MALGWNPNYKLAGDLSVVQKFYILLDKDNVLDLITRVGDFHQPPWPNIPYYVTESPRKSWSHGH
jgi:hypothetical protein